MEILIFGLILVALMVYASTRIKKNAARAFDREQVKTEDFSLVKPEGFIHVLNGNPEYAFEAYSKEFGIDGTESIRQARATIRVRSDHDFEDLRTEAIEKAERVVNEDSHGESGRRLLILESEEIEKGAIIDVIHQFAEWRDKIFDFEIRMLHDQRHDCDEKVRELFESFRLK